MFWRFFLSNNTENKSNLSSPLGAGGNYNIMKKRYLYTIAILAGCLFSSCDDQIMEWGKDPEHGEVTTAELPLQLAEKITRYDVLKTYAKDFTLGIGMGMDEYLSNPS